MNANNKKPVARSAAAVCVLSLVAGCASNQPRFSTSKNYLPPGGAERQQCVLEAKLAKVECESGAKQQNYACTQNARGAAEASLAAAMDNYTPTG